MIFHDSKNNIYETCGEPLGKGGEGAVYEVKGSRRYVLKIFKEEKRTQERCSKLRFMSEHPLKSQISQTAWPSAVVFDSEQNFAGYLMPRITSKENLNLAYSNSRRKYSFAQRVAIAANLCAAVDSVHEAGYVCGDLNPNNITVDPDDCRVVLLDCDSYHVTDPANGVTYRCEVGIPEYLPPEIQAKMKNGMSLSDAPLPTFTVESDLFALSVHIFALLMNGSHPFACASDSSTETDIPQPVDNIHDKFFPFHNQRPGITIPRYAPDFSMLPKSVKNLFCQAFEEGLSNPKARPGTHQWFEILKKMEARLCACRSNREHIFPDHLTKCPWCEVESKMKPSTFATVHYTKTPEQEAESADPHRQAKPGSGKNTCQRQNKNPEWNLFLIFVILFCIIFAAAAITIENKTKGRKKPTLEMLLKNQEQIPALKVRIRFPKVIRN